MPRTRTGLSYLSNNTPKVISPPGIFPARVEHIILNDKEDPRVFNRLGGWGSMGTIFFSKMNQASSKESWETYSFASPLFSNVKSYPLLNEIVYIMPLPSVGVEGLPMEKTYYYFQSVNIWNSTHHNAIPNAINNNYSPSSQELNYTAVEQGLVKRTVNEEEGIELGNTFIERDNIKPVQPFEGDIIYEGRWGQSLRFGSTVQNALISNNWSISGINGDPITILRNDQHNDDKNSWVPQIEDVNKDETSIYLTSTQQIPIEVASKKYNSYEKGLEPKPPNRYSNSQIILNSGRLLLNSHTDSILLSSNDSINLNSQETVNIDANEGFSVSVGRQGEIMLGSTDFGVVEPVILGDKFLADIENLANILINLGNNFEITPMLTTDEVSNSSLLNIGGELKQSAKNIITNIENYKSKVTFSK